MSDSLAMQFTAPVTFLFMDECAQPELNLSSLTGILVPCDRYRPVRDAMLAVIRDAVPATEGSLPMPLELHGNDLLGVLNGMQSEEALDRARETIWRGVVEIVNANRLHIIRTAYGNAREVYERLPVHPKLLGFGFLDVLLDLGPHLEETLLIPVMDGVPSAREGAKKAPPVDVMLIDAFAKQVSTLQHWSGHGVRVGVMNAGNIGDAVFADSAHSVLLQLADLVSYGLAQAQRATLRPSEPVSRYRRATLDQVSRLDPSLVRLKQIDIDVSDLAPLAARRH